jgi:hypothetical protein
VIIVGCDLMLQKYVGPAYQESKTRLLNEAVAESHLPHRVQAGEGLKLAIISSSIGFPGKGVLMEKE